MTRNKFLLSILGIFGLYKAEPTWEERLEQLFSYGTPPPGSSEWLDVHTYPFALTSKQVQQLYIKGIATRK